MNASDPIGLTGGIASGKSAVSQMFRDLGALILDTDPIAHQTMAPGSGVLLELRRAFGEEIINGDGSLNRQAMLLKLLEKPSNLKRQLEILAPYILPAVDAEISRIKRESPGHLLIVEASMLFEYGKPERYHRIIVVSAPRSMQIARLMKRSGKDEKWAAQVVDLQIPIELKTKMADYVIDNSSSLTQTQSQVDELYGKLKKTLPLF
jgi:dephospho-CoA kinase